MNILALLLSGGIVGVAMSLISHIPAAAKVSCVPCQWIWIGGILAAMLYSWIVDASHDRAPVDGLSAGIIVGIIAAVANAIFIALSSSQVDLSQMRQPDADIAPYMYSMQQKLGFSNLWQMEQMLIFVFQLIAYLIAGAISGYIGGLLFLKPSSRAVRPRM
jgi:hypothetical protein